MNIKECTSYFHDGNIFDIKQSNDNIEIWMESSEILPEWNVNIPLSSVKTIKGKLQLMYVRDIKIAEMPIKLLNRSLIDGEILKLRIIEKAVNLIVGWWDYSENNNSNLFEHITIQADNIEWENFHF